MLTSKSDKVIGICHLFILWVSQVLNSCIRILPCFATCWILNCFFCLSMYFTENGTTTMPQYIDCHMLDAQLFLLPQHVLYRERNNNSAGLYRETALTLQKVAESHFVVWCGVFVFAAKHVVREKDDIQQAMQFLQECELLKIEDILPFFSDFVTIDHFKDAICTSLQVTSPPLLCVCCVKHVQNGTNRNQN